MKKLTLFAAGAASQKYMQALADQQEIMGSLADCIMEVYAMESSILRAEKLRSSRQANAIAEYYCARAIGKIELAARKVVAAVAEGDIERTQMAIVRRLAKHEPADTIALSREIALHVIAAESLRAPDIRCGNTPPAGPSGPLAWAGRRQRHRSQKLR